MSEVIASKICITVGREGGGGRSTWDNAAITHLLLEQFVLQPCVSQPHLSLLIILTKAVQGQPSNHHHTHHATFNFNLQTSYLDTQRGVRLWWRKNSEAPLTVIWVDHPATWEPGLHHFFIILHSTYPDCLGAHGTHTSSRCVYSCIINTSPSLSSWVA